jgi:hypothetical protein
VHTIDPRPEGALTTCFMVQAPPLSQAAPVPPQSLEAHNSVLEAMLLSPDAIGAACEIVEVGAEARHG